MLSSPPHCAARAARFAALLPPISNNYRNPILSEPGALSLTPFPVCIPTATRTLRVAGRADQKGLPPKHGVARTRASSKTTNSIRAMRNGLASMIGSTPRPSKRTNTALKSASVAAPLPMPDVFTLEKRSAVMALIRSSGNKDTELRMIALFRAHGITGWRRNSRLFGKPDFVFRRERVVVFVDGCFWHRHENCKFAYTPKTRTEFWLPKFARNVARDKLVTRTLPKAGWRVMRVWECELAVHSSDRVVRRLKRVLQSMPR